MAYRLSKRFDSTQNIKTENVLRDGIFDGLTTSTIINNLKAEGLTYRRTNMLRDIRRAQAIEWSHDVGSEIRAASWYDDVFESFQEEKDLSPQEASDLWQKTVKESWDTIKEAELGAEWQELYEETF